MGIVVFNNLVVQGQGLDDPFDMALDEPRDVRFWKSGSDGLECRCRHDEVSYPVGTPNKNPLAMSHTH